MTRPRPALQDRGFALIAVLWMVAALAILVAGLVQSVRGEIGGVQHLLESTRAAATADAVTRLVVADILERNARPDTLERSSDIFEGLHVDVQIVPLSGLIDLNMAESPLLEALFVSAGGLDPAMAAQLAAHIVERRRADAQVESSATLPGDHVAQRRQRQQRFDVPEDLLQIPGVNYQLFGRIENLVTVGSGSHLVYPGAAPEDVLMVLASGNLEAARRFSESRDSGDPLADPTALSHRLEGSPGGSAYRIDAVVSLPSGARYVRKTWVDLSAEANGLPFRVLDMGALRAAGPEN